MISNAQPPREDANIWETNQVLIQSPLLMWFWRFISRCISLTCSFTAQCFQTSSALVCSTLLLAGWTSGAMHPFMKHVFLYTSAAGNVKHWCFFFPESLCIYLEVLILRTSSFMMENPEMFSFHELLLQAWSGLKACWLLKIIQPCLFSTWFTLCKSSPHQAKVLIISQNKSVSFFSDILSPHQQQKENFREQP